MKNLELKELDVQEMNATEMTTVNGGAILDGVATLVDNVALLIGGSLGSLLPGLSNVIVNILHSVSGLLNRI
ncbi:hypothetical protein AB6735_13345 [Mucilaginibacter sp. RCC_168]|uniref:hypothetical protein n=1 Tax=Mucilaginibacter sp. RCC_168 TaxID=3239221 RepID=UPI0035244FCA